MHVPHVMRQRSSTMSHVSSQPVPLMSSGSREQALQCDTWQQPLSLPGIALLQKHKAYVLPISEFSDSGRKPWTIIRRFDQLSFRTHNFSLEGAMKVKFALFYLVLRCPFRWYRPKLKVSVSGRKPWTIYYNNITDSRNCLCGHLTDRDTLLCYNGIKLRSREAPLLQYRATLILTLCMGSFFLEQLSRSHGSRVHSPDSLAAVAWEQWWPQ